MFGDGAALTVKLPHVVLVLADTLGKVLRLADVGCRALCARNGVNHALCFFLWWTVFRSWHKPSQCGRGLVGHQNTLLSQYSCERFAGSLYVGNAYARDSMGLSFYWHLVLSGETLPSGDALNKAARVTIFL